VAMTPEEVAAFIQSLGQKGLPQAADLNILQNAILGVLTGTYRPSYTAKTSTELVDEYMPNLADAASSDDPILRKIGQLITNGTSAWETRQEVKRLLANNAMSGIAIDSSLNNEYLEQVNLFDREWRAYNNASAKNERDRITNDPFLSAGLPGFEERYDPEIYAPALFEKFEKDLAARRATTKVYQPPKFPPGQKPSATWSPVRPGESKAELDAIRKELEQQRVIDPNAKYTPYWPGETDAGARRSGSALGGLGPVLRSIGRGLGNIQRNSGDSDQKEIKELEAKQLKTKTSQRKGPYAPGSVMPLSTKPFDVEKAGLAAGISKEYEDRYRAELRRLVAAQLEAEGKTPLLDQLTARGLFVAASVQPKTSKKEKDKSYRVKGSEVIRGK